MFSNGYRRKVVIEPEIEPESPWIMSSAASEGL